MRARRPSALSIAATQERFADRARAARRQPWRVAVGVLAVVGFLLLLGWLVWASPVLSVKDVEVQGVRGSDAADVTERVGAVVGTPLVRVDVDAVRARVAQKPSVRAVEVVRSWPSTLTVRVTPRTPAIVLQGEGGKLEIADAEGVRYATVAKAPQGVPMVTAAGAGAASPEAVVAALEVVRALPAELARQTRSITVSSANLVTLRLRDVTVVWGGPEQAQRKVALVEALLKTKPGVIDVSAPDTPVTRP